MVGIPGSGKSTFAERFAETFQAPLVSQTKLQRTFGLSDEAAVSLRDTILAEYLKTKRTVLIDGGVDEKTSREELAKQLKKAGYQPLVVWVQTDTNESLRRASKPYPRGSGMSADVFNAAVDQFTPPHEKEKTIVISGKHTYASQLKIILKQLATSSSSTPTSTTTPTATAAPPASPPPTRNVFIR